jgi:hypothetical protein
VLDPFFQCDVRALLDDPTPPRQGGDPPLDHVYVRNTVDPEGYVPVRSTRTNRSSLLQHVLPASLLQPIGGHAGAANGACRAAGDARRHPSLLGAPPGSRAGKPPVRLFSLPCDVSPERRRTVDRPSACTRTRRNCALPSMRR